jgi:hypothetical protein
MTFTADNITLGLSVMGPIGDFVTELKIAFGESPDFEYKDINPNTMRVIPVNFLKDHRDMLTKLHLFMHKGYLAIPSEHQDLITSLRTAQASDYSLDKQEHKKMMYLMRLD